LDIVTLGAGGGSIAALGANGTMQVGPRSAGARPGPACYGRGGTEPTVTDANLVLGYLNAGSFLGGAQRLDVAAADAAMASLATSLNITPLDTAAGIYRLVNARMADGVRVATVRRASSASASLAVGPLAARKRAKPTSGLSEKLSAMS
jgi:N-methylhydantoinase A